jgi:predicted lysophospholipase L1 biosynthesis ABC-type transport system permease subunit
MALGAQVAQVSRMIVTQSLTLASAGVVVGIMVSLAVTRLFRSLLFEVTPSDPFVLAGTAAILLLMSILASLGPHSPRGEDRSCRGHAVARCVSNLPMSPPYRRACRCADEAHVARQSSHSETRPPVQQSLITRRL